MKIVGNVRHIENPDDYSEYLADKGLADAYKQREEIERTHSIPKLIRMWVEWHKGQLSERPET